MFADVLRSAWVGAPPPGGGVGAGHEALGDVLLRRFRHFVATTRDAHALVVAVHNLS